MNPQMEKWDNCINLSNIHLNKDNKGVKIKNFKNPGLIAIKADWCGYCKRLKPEFIRAASKLNSKSLYVIDGEEIGDMINVRGFPTIKIVDKDGYITENYNGKRTSDDIVNFLENKLSDSTSKTIVLKTSNIIDTNGKIKIESNINKPGLLLIKADWCPHCIAIKKPYEDAAKENLENGYYILDSEQLKQLSPNVKNKLNIRGFPTIMYVESEGFLGIEYDGGRNKEQFIDKLKHKNRENFRYKQRDNPVQQNCKKLNQEQFYIKKNELYVEGVSNGILIIKDINLELKINNKCMRCYYINYSECVELCEYLKIKNIPSYFMIIEDGKIKSGIF